MEPVTFGQNNNINCEIGPQLFSTTTQSFQGHGEEAVVRSGLQSKTTVYSEYEDTSQQLNFHFPFAHSVILNNPQSPEETPGFLKHFIPEAYNLPFGPLSITEVMSITSTVFMSDHSRI